MPNLVRPTCLGCGAVIDFLPGTLAVRCQSCGAVVHVKDEFGGERSSYASPTRTHGTAPRSDSPTAHESTRLSAVERYEALYAERERIIKQLGAVLPGFNWFFIGTAGLIVAIVAWANLQLLLGWFTFFLFIWLTWRADRPRRRLVRARAEVDARLAGLKSALPHFHPTQDA